MTSGAKVQRWLAGCRELLALTQAQAEAIAKDDYARLEELFSHRGLVMDELGALEGEGLEPEPGWQEVQRLLEVIAEVDGENQRALAQRLAQVKESLTGMDKWRQAAQAYGGGELTDRGLKT